nr:SprB repeat-containing protein [Bacteroidota bacterium]
MLKKIHLFAFLIVSWTASAQLKWSNKNLYDQKHFIENKGQLETGKLPSAQEILFSSKIDGVQYYFTSTGYTIGRFERVKRSRKEIVQITKDLHEDNEEDDKEFKYKTVEKFHEFRFSNSNSAVELIKGNKLENYYSYSLNRQGKKETVIAYAYSSITYKNIYPFTDVLMEFPNDSTGIKYSIILHPGADVNKIRIMFSDKSDFKIRNNNIEISTPFGKIVDHQPVTFTAKNRSSIKSSFKVIDNTIGFDLGVKRITETIVIDPWTVTPTFTSSNSAFDIDYDNAGNVYVYGGNTGGPYTLLKYSPAGTLVWSYTPALFSTGSAYYGDFAVDRNSNNIYLVEGFNYISGSQVVKINSSAVMLASFAGNPQFIEMWRIGFSRCTNQAVIAGGGTSSPTYQTCYLDTNLVSLSPVTYIPTPNCCHDVGLLALDNYGNCYQSTNKPLGFADGLFENHLVKLPLPALLPVTYNVPTGHGFLEAASVMYYGGSPSNGYNGLTTSNTKVFSYDGYVLKEWDGPTGNQLSYNRIKYPAGGDSSLVYWGGITADDCGNLFIGDSNMVRQYDSTLTLTNSYLMTGIVTDVMLSITGELYVCGLGFATSLTPVGMVACTSGGTLSLNVSAVDATCTSPGSATVTVSGGSPPYSIVWNTSPPQYGTSISGVPPGTYTVTVNEGSCLQSSLTGTVTIGASAGAFFSTPLITTGCPGSVNQGTISVSPTGGLAPYSYSWSTAAPTTADSIGGLAPGTYTLTITDAGGCTNVYSALIIDTPSVMTYTFSHPPIECFGDTTSLSVVPNGGSAPYSVNWTTPVATGLIVYGVNAGNFAGTVMDASGCSDAFVYTLTQPSLFTATSSTSINCSTANSGVITVNPAGGNSPYSYSWSGFPANLTNTLSSAAPGTYTVTVTDSNMCSITIIDTVDSYTPLTETSTIADPCFDGSNGSIVANVTGGTPSPYQYSWTGYPTNNTNTLGSLASGTYTLTVTSGPCTNTSVFVVNEDPITDTLNFVTEYCEGDKTTSIFLPLTTSQPPYQWYTGIIPVTGANQNTYNGQVSNLNNYSLTWFMGGCGYVTTGVDSIVHPQLSAATPANVFSPNNDNDNELF